MQGFLPRGKAEMTAHFLVTICAWSLTAFLPVPPMQVLNLRDEQLNGLQQAVHVLNPNGSKRPASEISGGSEQQSGEHGPARH